MVILATTAATRGTAKTLHELAVIWTKPDDLEIDPHHPLLGLGQFQAGFFMALLADGCLNPVPNSIDPKTLVNLFNPHDGQVVDLP